MIKTIRDFIEIGISEETIWNRNEFRKAVKKFKDALIQ